MKSTNASHMVRGYPWYLNAYAWLLVPVFAVVGAVAIIVIREVSASREMNRSVSNVARLQKSGRSFALLDTYNAEASHDNTSLWLDVMAVANSEYARMQQRNLGYVLYSGSTEQIRDDGLKWGERVSEFSPERLKQFVDEFNAVITKIKNACSDRRQVWLPLEPSTAEGFRNMIPPLDSTISVQQMLSLEVEYAVHVRDGKRALEALEAMSVLPSLFSPPVGWIAYQVSYMNQRVYTLSLGRAIMRDMWTEEQLESMRRQLKQSQISLEVWPDLFEQNKQMLLQPRGTSRFTSGPEIATIRVLQVPSFQKRIAEVSERAKHIADDGLGQLTKRSFAFEQSLKTEMDDMERDVVFHTAQVRAIAAAFVYAENERRMLATAIALRIYRKKFDKWPVSIDELVKVGLGYDEMQYLDGMRLGYSAGSEPDSPARLWNLVRVPVVKPNDKELAEQLRETKSLVPLEEDEIEWERGRATPRLPAVDNTQRVEGEGFELEVSLGHDDARQGE